MSKCRYDSSKDCNNKDCIKCILGKVEDEIVDLADADAYNDYQYGFSMGLWKAVEIINKHKEEWNEKK